MITMVRTDRLGETLYIPPAGVLQVFQRKVDPVSLLTGSGKYTCVHVGTTIHVHFRATETGPENPRATAVLATLTDVNMEFIGPVVFEGMAGDRVYQILERL